MAMPMMHLFINTSKATPADIEAVYDVCWMLSPLQIQQLCANYYVADYEVSIISIALKD